MSLINSAFYSVMDKATNKDTYDGLAGSLGEQFGSLSELMGRNNEELIGEVDNLGESMESVEDVMEDQISIMERQLDELTEITKSDEAYHRSFMDYTKDSLDHVYDNRISDIEDNAFDSLVERMRLSTFRVEMVNAEYDIVDPMLLGMRELSLDGREESLAFHHETTMWYARMVEVMESLKKDETDAGRGVVLATRQFLRHPVWYTLTGAAQAMANVGKFLGGVTLGTLFGFGRKETVHEKLLSETKKQTEFMLTGKIDQGKTLWQQFKSGGVSGLIGRDIAANINTTLDDGKTKLNLQELAQHREDARASGSELQGGIRGRMADFFFKNEVTKKKWDHSKKDDNPSDEDTYSFIPSEDFIEGQFRVIHDDILELSNYNEALIRLEHENNRLLALAHQESPLADFLVDISNIINEQREEVMVAMDSQGNTFEHISRGIGGGFTRTEEAVRENSRQNERSSVILRDEMRGVSSNIQDLEDTQDDRVSLMTRLLRKIYGEGKKTNRHLLMAKLMAVMSGIGSFFTNFKSGAGFKLLGAGLAAYAFKNIKDGILSGDGIGIMDVVGSTFAGLLIGGIKGAAVGFAFSVGTAVGTFLNDNVINPFIEKLTGREGETLGSAIWEWFHGTGLKAAQDRSDSQIETGNSMMGNEGSQDLSNISWADYDAAEMARERSSYLGRTFGIGVKSDAEMKEMKQALELQDKTNKLLQERAEVEEYERQQEDPDLEAQHQNMLRTMGMKIDPETGVMVQDKGMFGDKKFNPNDETVLGNIKDGITNLVRGSEISTDEQIVADEKNTDKIIDASNDINRAAQEKEDKRHNELVRSLRNDEETSQTVMGKVKNFFGMGGTRPSSDGGVSSLGNVTEKQQQMVAALEQQGIKDPTAQANILAQIQHESGFNPRSEELTGYSAETLFRLYGEGNKGGNKVRFKTKEDAQNLVARGPEAVGNVIYGGRMGNAMDEGFKYRGRGLIQLTGKYNYRKYGDMIGVDLVSNPDLANDPQIAQQIAAAYFAEKQKGGTDLTDINAVGKAVGYAGGAEETARRSATAQDILQRGSTDVAGSQPATSPVIKPVNDNSDSPAATTGMGATSAQRAQIEQARRRHQEALERTGGNGVATVEGSSYWDDVEQPQSVNNISNDNSVALLNSSGVNTRMAGTYNDSPVASVQTKMVGVNTSEIKNTPTSTQTPVPTPQGEAGGSEKWLKRLVELAESGGISFGGTPDNNTTSLIYGA